MMSELAKLRQAESLRDLAGILGYQPHALSFILYKIPSAEKYTTFTIPKKSGGTRKIRAPIPHLKELQRRLSILLVACSEEINLQKKWSKSLSHGFKKQHSIVTNGRQHKGNRYVFNIDLNDFFPSINFGRVRGFFIKNKEFRLNPKIATLIAQIACHENELPQGSPCSPVISNLIGHLLDIRLAKLAKKHRCKYTRYADDLTFSTNLKKFPKGIARQKLGILPEWSLGNSLKRILDDEGFHANPNKTRMQYRTSRQLVTGLVVNKIVNVKSEYYRTARSMCHSLFRTGKFHFYSHEQERKLRFSSFLPLQVARHAYRSIFGFPGKKRHKKTLERIGTMPELEGILSHIYYVKKIGDGHFLKSHNRRVEKSHNTITLIDKQNPKEKGFSGIRKLYREFLFYKNFYGLQKPLLICEGKTDYAYLRCALKSLAASFGNLITISSTKVEYHVRFFNYTKTTGEVLHLSGGTSNLVYFIRNYKSNITRYTAPGKNHPVIILIDNDDGAAEVYSALRNVTGDNSINGSKSYYFVTGNLYVVPTPLTATGGSSKIEDLFEPSVLATEVGGKKFNAANEINSDKEYGKHIFAEQVIKKNRASINFKDFEKILKPLEAVIKDYAARII